MERQEEGAITWLSCVGSLGVIHSLKRCSLTLSRRSSKRTKRDTKKPVRTCPYCVDVVVFFSSDTRLDEHLRSMHLDRIFECEMCSRVHDRALLIDHMEGHADEEQGGTEAEPETVVVVAGGGNKENQRLNNGPKRLFGCLFCGDSFGYKCALKQHVKARHSAVRGYQCTMCEKAFKGSSALYNHRKLIHDPHFSFPCNQCEQKFKLQHELQRHQKSVHERERQYFCDVCPKAFFLQDSLTRHRKTHAKEFMFECDQCLFRTTQKRYLDRHLMRHQQKTGKKGKGKGNV